MTVLAAESLMNELSGCAEAQALLEHEIRYVEQVNDQQGLLSKKIMLLLSREIYETFVQPFNKSPSNEVREDLGAKKWRAWQAIHVKPTFSSIPTANVKYDDASGSLKGRCHDIRHLTFQRTKRTIQWFQYKPQRV